MGWFKRNNEIKQIGDLIKTKSPDFDGLFSNISARDETHKLYNRLVVRIHPDRYISTNDDKKITRATELFAQLQANKTDISALKKLEKIINLEFKEYEM